MTIKAHFKSHEIYFKWDDYRKADDQVMERPSEDEIVDAHRLLGTFDKFRTEHHVLSHLINEITEIIESREHLSMADTNKGHLFFRHPVLPACLMQLLSF